jgi:outer membrane biosynthesis protein TonB
MSGRIRMAMACTGLLIVAAASARAQTAFRETGSITVGGYLVWVRGTNANVVQLFVAHGFRDAFAKAHDMNEARLQQWIDSVRAVQPVPADDSSSLDAQLRGTALGTDVTMMRRVGGSYSGLRVLVSGEEPIRMAETTARDFIAMLDSATRVTRELSVPAPTIMASMPMRDASPRATAAPATAAPAPVAPVAAPPVPAAPRTDAVSAPPASAPAPAPELVLPTPSERVAPVGTAPALSSLPAPSIKAPVATAPVAAPVAAPAVAPVIEPVVPPPAVAPPPAPAVAAPGVVAAAADTAASPHVDVPSDKLIRTPLGPFTIPGALLSDRDKEAQYCYTQLGLKYNPDLKGEITVKLSLRTDGAVEDAVVVKRSWQGISAGEVESCVRALAHDWTFASNDPSVADGAKSLTFSFAP